LLCQLHSEGACFIKARISCEQPTANQSLAAEVPRFLARPVETKFEEAVKVTDPPTPVMQLLSRPRQLLDCFLQA
jgi:hypothetical protein